MMPHERAPLLVSLRSAVGSTVHAEAPSVFAWLRWDDDAGARWPEPAAIARRIEDAVPVLAGALEDPTTVAHPEADVLAALCALTARIAWHLQRRPDGGHGALVPAAQAQRARPPESHAARPPESHAARPPEPPAPWRPPSPAAAHCAYAFAEFGEPAMRIAVALVRAACQRDPRALERAGQAAGGLLDATAAAELDGASALMRRRALQRGIPVHRVSPRIRLLQLGQGVRAHRTFESGTDQDAHTGGRLAANKMATAELLHRLGLPGAVHRPARTVDEARRIARAYGYPVVVKPSHGEKQAGVTIGVRDDTELAAAFEKARRARAGLVLVERFAPGSDFRLLVAGGRLASVALRRPATVVGDGRSSIDALIDVLNADPNRGPGDAYALVPVGRDAELDEALGRQGMRLTDVPAPGAAVYLRVNPTPMHGGTVEECVERVHPDIRAMAETIARALKVQVLGIDFVCPDITRSWRAVGGTVCEVNLTPGHRPHGQRGIDAILDVLFPQGGDGRIPTAALLGPRAGTQCRLMAALLAACGRTVGRVMQGAVSVGGVAVRAPAGGLPLSPAVVFEHPDVDCAVFALDEDAPYAGGLPFDQCDVLVTTTDDEVALAHVLQRVHGAVVMAHGHPALARVVASGGAARVDCVHDTVVRSDVAYALAACLRLGVSADALASALEATGLAPRAPDPAAPAQPSSGVHA